MPILTGAARRRGTAEKLQRSTEGPGRIRRCAGDGEVMLRRHTNGSARARDPVYPPREDTLLLLPFAHARRGERVLEIGCGEGAAALAAALRGARVVATDLNPFALRAVRMRARELGVAVATVRTDLARGLGRFDRILANPPYLPTRPTERDPDHWENLALDGGPSGSRVTARILRSLPAHLAARGVAYLLLSSAQSASSRAALARSWTRLGGERRVVAERRLEGETLWVWELRRPGRSLTRGSRRGAGPRRRSGDRPPSPPRPRRASSPAPARGRTRAPGAASARRRSPPGS